MKLFKAMVATFVVGSAVMFTGCSSSKDCDSCPSEAKKEECKKCCADAKAAGKKCDKCPAPAAK